MQASGFPIKVRVAEHDVSRRRHFAMLPDGKVRALDDTSLVRLAIWVRTREFNEGDPLRFSEIVRHDVSIISTPEDAIRVLTYFAQTDLSVTRGDTRLARCLCHHRDLGRRDT